MPILNWLYRHTFNSVPFGIAILVSIALYVAVGSGLVGVREWLEMDEMLFFNWWPMKLLAILLIVNLSVVTVTRIPLTVPRYGVWTIHMGIILLVLSVSAYYSRKVEGYVHLSKGQTASTYYDRWDRALFVRTQFSTSRGTPLPGLPRFHAYDPSLGNADTLDRSAFHGMQPMLNVVEQTTGNRSRVTLGEALGLKQDVRLDVVGYYPYGRVDRWKIDPKATGTALQIRPGDHADSPTPLWIVAGRASESVVPVGPAAIEYRQLPTKADVAIQTAAAKQLHDLSIKVGNVAIEDHVEPGDAIVVGDSGYLITVEGFTPNFALSSNDGKTADVLSVLVTKKNADGTEHAFRRLLLSGVDTPTDFDLTPGPGIGPMGKRQKPGILLDDQIQLGYRFSDPTGLLSKVGETTVKYILFTTDDAPGLTMLRVSSREPSIVNEAGDEVDLHVTAPAGMFAGDAKPQQVADLNVRRVDHVAESDEVVEVPSGQRDREIASSGRGQVVRVRITCGEWSKIVPVGYDPFAFENRWSSPRITIPGASGDLQLQLGNAMRTLPVDVRLDGFEAVPYAGGDASGSSIMRDFRSTITTFQRGDDEGRPVTETASMNNPAFVALPGPAWFVPGESWLLSQASWDPSDLNSTVLQVGNRPAVGMMLTACLMIFAGLMYAFYAKPIIIRKRKQRALREARAAAEQKIEAKAAKSNYERTVVETR